MTIYTGFLGSYTRRKSTGLRRFAFDGKEFRTEDFMQIGNPAYLALSEDGNILYSVVKHGDASGTASIDINEKKVTGISTADGEAPPCYISLIPEGLLACNYHAGNLDLYAIKDGVITGRRQSIGHDGSGPVTGRQDSSHIHFSMKNPYNEDILVCDLGTDRVWIYSYNGELRKKDSINFPAGSGPRHLVFHRTEKIAYVLSELTSEVFTIDFRDGSYRIIHSSRALPGDFQGNSIAAAIRISNDNRFIYTSNRGHESITIFKVTESFTTSVVDIVPSHGKHPRDFNISPDGKYLLLANMETDNLALYSVDQETGGLEIIRSDIYSPECVSVVFEK